MKARRRSPRTDSETEKRRRYDVQGERASKKREEQGAHERGGRGVPITYRRFKALRLKGL